MLVVRGTIQHDKCPSGPLWENNEEDQTISGFTFSIFARQNVCPVSMNIQNRSFNHRPFSGEKNMHAPSDRYRTFFWHWHRTQRTKHVGLSQELESQDPVKINIFPLIETTTTKNTNAENPEAMWSRYFSHPENTFLVVKKPKMQFWDPSQDNSIGI